MHYMEFAIFNLRFLELYARYTRSLGVMNMDVGLSRHLEAASPHRTALGKFSESGIRS
jgi:hypothetical protein